MGYAARFWSKVDVCDHGMNCSNCCWEWLANRHPKGYGQFSLHGRTTRARITAWELHYNRDFPPGLHALHSCDNPPCTSPWHIYPGTNLRNMRDRGERGRVYHPKGSLHGEAKLTETQINPIRILYALGECTQEDLGRIFGVSRVKIGHIVRGKAWTHVQFEW